MTILLDAGHGEETPGKRSPKWKKGQYLEYLGTRAIRKFLAEMLDECDIPYHYVTVGNKDIDLDDRVDIVNQYCRAYGAGNCLLISIHSNGFKDEEANGWEVFTTRGTTKSDAYATELFHQMQKEFPNQKYRTDKKDGDVDKEANFYIIANSKCPAILSENFFHTNEEECTQILMENVGMKAIAKAHFEMIRKAIYINN